jgi:hypothetical protein
MTGFQKLLRVEQADSSLSNRYGKYLQACLSFMAGEQLLALGYRERGNSGRFFGKQQAVTLDR